MEITAGTHMQTENCAIKANKFDQEGWKDLGLKEGRKKEGCAITGSGRQEGTRSKDYGLFESLTGDKREK